ncbi:RNA-guided endonuclease InsQ/TnpB family protein [Fervidobacterium gondwanense]|uniref:RNA-guided endonuclease InsQ/TnpB family protein n=1 Tax=Fervidobacterium gondwanense TaxID=44754 RepID=UPI003C71229C
MTKAERIKQTRLETNQKRKEQIPVVYQLKVNLNSLSKKDRQRLFFLFSEAKWLYNYIVADIDSRLKYETYKLSEVEIKAGDKFETRPIENLSSQMRQVIVERIKQSLYALHKSKDNGNKVGELKFKSFVNSIPLKQYDVTFKFTNEQKTKVKLQGLEKSIRVLGGHQIPKECEIAKAELVRKASGIYLHATCYIDKSLFIKTWENRVNRKQVSKPREWKTFNQAIAIDFKPTGVVLSNGLKIEWKIEETPRLKKLQRTISRKQKGSKNRQKVRVKLRKEYEHITNVREDIVNKISSLLYRYDTVIYQDDNIHVWHKGQFSKSIQTSAVGEIKRRLRNSLRVSTVLIDRYQPTTKTCSQCGNEQEIELSDRVYRCAICGNEMDRDLNATYNLLKLVGLDRSEVRPVEHETTVKIFGANPKVLISLVQ